MLGMRGVPTAPFMARRRLLSAFLEAHAGISNADHYVFPYVYVSALPIMTCK